MKKSILYISPNFNLTCGVSKSVYTWLTSEELKKEFNLYFVTNGGDALQKLDKAGIKYSLINLKTDKFFHFDLFRNLKWLRNYCEEKEINIIHSHHRYPEYLSNRIKESLGIKTVVTVHNFVAGFKKFSYRSDFIIAISNVVKNHLINSFGIDSDKVEVLYNCIKPVYATKKRKEDMKTYLGIPQDHFVLLFAGRMVLEKGIETLIDSFNLLKGSLGKTVLLMVGGDKSLITLKPDRFNSDKIILQSAKEDLRDFYEASDVVILPSLKEGLGYTMLEAGYFKKPFIGSRTGGIEEFIDDGVNGFLFEPGNADDLADKIRFVINNPQKSKSAAEELHKKVKKYCNCEDYFVRLKGIYEELLGA